MRVLPHSITGMAFLLLTLLPFSAVGQALAVLGGDAWAQACFDNAEYAAVNMPIVSRSLIEPCDKALDYGTLSLADRAATYANRGIIKAAINDIDSAMADYRKAMNFRPESAEIFVNRGNAYFLEKEFALALADYERSIELGIRKIQVVRYNMGMAYEQLGNYEVAESQFRMALDIEPGWEVVEKRLARNLEIQRRRTEEAAGKNPR